MQYCWLNVFTKLFLRYSTVFCTIHQFSLFSWLYLAVTDNFSGYYWFFAGWYCYVFRVRCSFFYLASQFMRFVQKVFNFFVWSTLRIKFCQFDLMSFKIFPVKVNTLLPVLLPLLESPLKLLLRNASLTIFAWCSPIAEIAFL